MSEMVTPGAVAACVPELPEAAIRGILERVPDVVLLFRCTVVCKMWGRIIADPVFLRSCSLSLRGNQSSLLGFFVQSNNMLSANDGKKVRRLSPSVFVPAPGSALGPERRFLTSFIHDDEGILDNAKPLVARDGLLLVRVLPPFSERNTVISLCLCNLVTGKRDLLPPIDSADIGDDDGARGFAVFTAADHAAGSHQPAAGYSTFFRVLVVGVNQLTRQGYQGEFFSGAPTEPVWSLKNIEGVLDGLHRCHGTAAVISGGGDTANWIFHRRTRDGYMFHVSVNSEKIRKGLIHSRAWFCGSIFDEDPSLAYVVIGDKNLNVWILDDENWDEGDYAAWGKTESVRVGGAEQWLSGLVPACVAVKSGTVLVLYLSNPGQAYLVDLRSGSTTMVEGWIESLNHMTVVSWEINFLEFFKSRVGVKQ